MIVGNHVRLLLWDRKEQVKGGVGATLSDHWVKELSCIVSWAFESLSICRKVNDACIGRMETPEAVLEALPKHAKQLAMGDAMRKALEKGEKAQSELAEHKAKEEERAKGIAAANQSQVEGMVLAN